MDLDELLKDDHEDAGKDFDEGKDKDGADKDDEIKKLHDTLGKILEHVGGIHEKMSGKEVKKIDDETKIPREGEDTK